MTDTRRRALIAALVGVLGASVGVAGAGHVYLREWRRGFAWFTFVLGVGLVLVSVSVDPTTLTMASLTDLPSEVTAPIFVLLFLSAFDAYYLAARGHPRSDGLQCPVCRGELDPEVTFCPWCATEFETPPRGPETFDAESVRSETE
ncbi:DUF7575 domain-containing protein [Halogeometricum limi]|uniref:DUF7575 domain-containing protein n=1 Tax=Halogeometricum limi TaxID=555875 RepID=A0A1I6G7M3_9EURY|nr:hypothetical protein [Halogeometricum limi]SFR38130.1 hypothetical protein SAMN04488124_0981 [Halogeometricum limi]